jgi:hypothetical protein
MWPLLLGERRPAPPAFIAVSVADCRAPVNEQLSRNQVSAISFFRYILTLCDEYQTMTHPST